MGIIIVTAALMLVSLYLLFVWVSPAAVLGETSRVLYLHVPLAWIASLAFAVSGFASIQYIRKKEYIFVHYARSSAHIGFFFSVLTVITGSLWAKVMWGSYWNWDPRETSIVLLLLVYVAYFSLHQIVHHSPQAAMLESVYLVIAFVASPFLIFVAPRLYPSLHPDPVINVEGRINLDGDMRLVLMVSVFSFTLLYIILLRLWSRVRMLEHSLDEDEV